jgi:cell division protein FtsI (penicillin-binding protein 3)
VSDQVAAAVNKLHLPGINLVPESQRVEPDGLLAEPVVGTVNYDGAGDSGLEYQYQSTLAGKAGSEDLMQAPDGVALTGDATGGAVASRPGSGVELTLDQSIQYVAEQALGAEIAAAHATGGTAVVMDVKSGDVLAMADLTATPPGTTAMAPSGTSGPTLVSSSDTLPAGVEEAPSNSAVTQVYEPGSVFKLVTFSAALAAGAVTPNQAISVPSALPMGKYTFHDAESHGTESLTATQILAQSSNIGTIEVAERLGEDRLLAQIGNLGFGRPTGLGFPGESEGLVPGASAWTGTSIGSTPIGQDDAVTAQQILDAYNSVADGGVFVAPRIVRGTVSPSGSVTPTASSPTRRVIDPATDAELVSMLESVVASGTGTSAAIDGYTVAGKTGTAQIPDPNHLGYIPGAYVGTFAGFAPAEHPVLSAVVVLDHPTPIYGGAVAAPVFSTIMAYALHHYGIPTTTAATASASTTAVGSTGTITVPAGAVTEGP